MSSIGAFGRRKKDAVNAKFSLSQFSQRTNLPFRVERWSPLRRLALLALSVVLFAPPPVATAGDNFTEALTGGKVNIDIRYRYETVDQDGIARDAKAHTVRSRLGYETGDFHGFVVGLEFQNTTGIGSERYNDTINGKTQFPVVADPDNTEANQYYVANSSLPETTVKVGRQRIILDNHRFVGTVGFRQNEQTFDSARLDTGIIPDVTATYIYVYLVNRIFGEDSRVGDFETNSHLINLSYTGLSFGKLTGYGYLLDFDEASTLSSKTFGARFAGKRPLNDDWKLLYTAEAAWQSDHANNPNSDSFGYYLIEPGVAYDTVSAKAGYEVLSGNGTRAFQTPTATLHAFQGWADKFLSTPGSGIEDLYIRLDYTAKGFDWFDGTKFTGVYHWFDAEEGSADLGRELDLQVSRKLYDYFTVALKYARYDADTFATDTEKIWFIVGFKY